MPQTFIKCEQGNVALLQSLGALTGAYDKARGGVTAELDGETRAKLAEFPADFVVEEEGALRREDDERPSWGYVCEHFGLDESFQYSDAEQERYYRLLDTKEQAQVGVGYLKDLPLQEALWWFIENVSDETENRSELFFALRARVRTEPTKADISTMDDHAIVQELRSRGTIPSIWNVEDMDGVLEEDDLASHLDEDQFERLRGLLLEEVSHGLEGALAAHGNNYVSDKWERVKADLLAQVQTQATEASSSPSP